MITYSMKQGSDTKSYHVIYKARLDPGTEPHNEYILEGFTSRVQCLDFIEAMLAITEIRDYQLDK